jgi:hypothetical protein
MSSDGTARRRVRQVSRLRALDHFIGKALEDVHEPKLQMHVNDDSRETILLRCFTKSRFVNCFERCYRGAIQCSAIRRKLRTVTGTIPTLFE